MDLEKLIDAYDEEIAEDTTLDELNVKDRVSRSCNIRQKWVTRLRKAHYKLAGLIEEKNEMIDFKLKKTSLPVSVTNIQKSKLVEADEDIKDINKRISEQQHLVEYLEATSKNISGFGFDAKNYIAILQMENI